MLAVARKSPCPCGSGKKYKRCCLVQATLSGAQRTDIGLRPTTQVVTHRGERFLTTGGMSEEGLDVAADFFERKRRGQGPAQQMADFVQPLLDTVGHDLDGMNRAMGLGMLFWNVACKDDQLGEEMLSEFTRSTLETDQQRQEFRALANDMIKRHRQMFPEHHR